VFAIINIKAHYLNVLANVAVKSRDHCRISKDQLNLKFDVKAKQRKALELKHKNKHYIRTYGMKINITFDCANPI
jgi:hypothetical protein